MTMFAIRHLTRPSLLVVATFAAVGCSDDSDPASPNRALTTVSVSFSSPTIEVGEFTGATASGLDQSGYPVQVGAVSWTSDQPTIAAVNPTTGVIFAVAPGTTRVTATVDAKVGSSDITVVRPPAIRINEVRSAGETAGGWIELVNPTSASVDLTGWTLVDNVFSPEYRLPAGSVIAPNGYLVIEEASLPFGVDDQDAALLFSKFGVLVDSQTWTQGATGTFGLCPDAAGPFGPTVTPSKGMPNVCS